MNRRIGLRLTGPLAVLVACVGCDSGELTDDPGVESNLVIANSSPPSGNAILTRAGVASGPILSSIELRENVGGISHKVMVRVESATLDIRQVEHYWGPLGGAYTYLAMCDNYFHPCDSSRIDLDVAGREITLSHLSLGPTITASAYSSLDGTIKW